MKRMATKRGLEERDSGGAFGCSRFLIGRLSAQVEYLKGGANVAAVPTAAPQAQASKIDVAGLKKLPLM